MKKDGNAALCSVDEKRGPWSSAYVSGYIHQEYFKLKTQCFQQQKTRNTEQGGTDPRYFASISKQQL